MAVLDNAQRIRESIESAQDRTGSRDRRGDHRRADPHRDQRGRAGPAASSPRARSGATRGVAAGGAGGHDVRGRERRARHPHRDRDVAPFPRPRAVAPPHGRRGEPLGLEGGAMTEEEDRMEYAEQNNALRRQFDPVLTEPIPARMFMKRPVWMDYARAAVLVGV